MNDIHSNSILSMPAILNIDILLCVYIINDTFERFGKAKKTQDTR